MECLFPKKENEEVKKDWLEERRHIRKYNARLSAILDELAEATLGNRPEGVYHHYEHYKNQQNVVMV